MKKEQKKKFVKNFKDILNNVGILVVTHYSGLKTTQTDELRIKIREAGGKFLIVKNTLMKIILKDLIKIDSRFDEKTALICLKLYCF